MVVLSERPEEYLESGFTPERHAEALRSIQRRLGMPIDTRARPRMAATVEACRAVVAARVHDGARAPALLRRLRVRGMAGDLIDEPEVIAAAAEEAGLDPVELEEWTRDPAVEVALRADADAARDPSAAARALDHKLAGWSGGRRLTCPSYVIERADGARLDVPGYQPVESYEAAIANLAPELERRPVPESVEEALRWAGEPLATVEVAALCGLEPIEAREQLAAVADEEPVGADGYWSLPAA